MADIAKAYVQIVPSAQGIKGSISSILGDEASSAGESSGATLGNSLVSKLKSVIAAAGIAKIVSEALNAGGALQQSFGGIETIYTGAEEAMKSYAATAATLGISANTYAEQAVSFGAALKQSFGGDAVQAAEAANLAITDMADNSAKMGTSIEAVQNAYQGFAKQNYTMLDNLKLGYGGTKTEMQRLIADANKLKVAQGEVGDLTIGSYGDIVEAIHLVQEELGVSGTAAYEAGQTFTGSMAAMKASAENVLAALTTGSMDLTPQLESLASNVSNFLFNNLLPMLGSFITGLPSSLGTFLQTAIPLFLENLGTLKDDLITLLGDISSNIATQIPTFLENILPKAKDISVKLREGAGELVDSGLELILNIAKGIADGIPTMVENIPEIVSNIAGIINDNAPKILETGVQVIVTLVKGLIKAIPTIVKNMPKIIKAIWDTITAINWVELGGKIIKGLLSGITGLFSSAKKAASNIGETIKTAISNKDWKGLGSKVINLVKNGISLVSTGIKNVASKLADGIKDKIDTKKWQESGSSLVEKAKSGINSVTSSIVSTASSMASNIKSKIDNTAWYQTGTNIVNTAKSGISGVAGSIYSTAKGVASAIKGKFDGESWYTTGNNIINVIKSGVNGVSSSIISTASSIAGNIKTKFSNEPWYQTGSNIISNIKNGISNMISAISSTASSVVSSIKNAFSIDWSSIGSNIISGIKNGISNGIQSIKDAAAEAASAAYNKAKSVLGIKSPSRAFKYLGEMVDEGFAKGLEDDTKVITKAMDDITSTVLNPISGTLSLDSKYSANSFEGGINSGYSQVINVYSPEALKPSEVARQTRNATRQMALAMSRG